MFGGSASPQTHEIGTIFASSTTPGRKLSTLPWIAALALLPNVIWIAPDSTATALIMSLTILSATGRPAAALSTGSLPVADHAAAIGGLTMSASLIASTMRSRISFSGTPGTAMRAMIAMMAITIISSSREKPGVRRGGAGERFGTAPSHTVARRAERAAGMTAGWGAAAAAAPHSRPAFLLRTTRTWAARRRGAVLRPRCGAGP